MSSNWNEVLSLAKEELSKANADIHGENGAQARFAKATKAMLKEVQELTGESTESIDDRPIVASLLRSLHSLFQPDIPDGISLRSASPTPSVDHPQKSGKSRRMFLLDEAQGSLPSIGFQPSFSARTAIAKLRIVNQLVEEGRIDPATKLFLSFYVPSFSWSGAPDESTCGRTSPNDDVNRGSLALDMDNLLAPQNAAVESVREKLHEQAVELLQKLLFSSINSPRPPETTTTSTTFEVTSDMLWYRKRISGVCPETRDALSMVWHLSGRRDEAWDSIVECFRDEKIKAIMPKDYVSWTRDREGDRKNLKQRKFVCLHRELVNGLVEGISGPQPQTFLQLIGHIILKSLTHQLPLILSLPESAPPSVLMRLYVEPFTRALEKAINTVLTDTRVHPSAFITHVQSRAEDRIFQPIYMATGTPVEVAPRMGTNKGASGRSIVGVISNLYSDSLELLQGVHLIFNQCHMSRPKTFVEVFEKEMTDVWESVREKGGNSIHAYVVDSAQRILQEGSEDGDPLDVGHNVLRDAWPARTTTSTENLSQEGQRPRALAVHMHQVLSFVSMNLHRIHRVPVTLQAPLVIGALDAMRACMDNLSSVRVPRHQFEGSRKSLFALSGALCARRRLFLFQKAFDIKKKDPVFFHFVHLLGACLAQADEVVHNIRRYIVSIHCELMSSHIFLDIDVSDWKSYKLPLKRKKDSGSSVRLWRGQLVTLVRDLSEICSHSMAEDLFAQILLETTSSLVIRYLHIAPSKQWLDRYLADVYVILSTAHLLSQPIRVKVKASNPETIDEDLTTEEIDIQVSQEAVAKLCKSCKKLCVRAGLLLCSPTDLDAVSLTPRPSDSCGASEKAEAWGWCGDFFTTQGSPTFKMASEVQALGVYQTGLIMDENLRGAFRALCVMFAMTADLSEVKGALARRWEMQDLVEGLELTDEEVESRRLIRDLHHSLSSPTPMEADRKALMESSRI
ncbi:hypothetical protein BSKO_06586 [Bryopsis sp. KO-2023]|nr:hypothetical protein BSKO_06586 [Bryopsis sp. KO-2023]